MIAVQGEEMLDTEFRGGTVATLQFRVDPETGEQVRLTREEVEQRVDEIAAQAGEGSPLTVLQNADIVAIDSNHEVFSNEASIMLRRPRGADERTELDLRRGLLTRTMTLTDREGDPAESGERAVLKVIQRRLVSLRHRHIGAHIAIEHRRHRGLRIHRRRGRARSGD